MRSSEVLVGCAVVSISIGVEAKSHKGSHSFVDVVDVVDVFVNDTSGSVIAVVIDLGATGGDGEDGGCIENNGGKTESVPSFFLIK